MNPLQRLLALLRQMPNGTTTYRQIHQDIFRAASALLDAADDERRALTTDESRAYDEATAALARYQTEIRSGNGDRAPQPGLRDSDPPAADNRRGNDTMPSLLTRDQRVRDYVGRRLSADDQALFAPGSFGRFLKGIGGAGWRGAEAEHRAAMSVGQDASAGYLAPDAFGSMLIDMVRAQTTVQRAGARTLVMEDGSVGFPKLTASPGATWHAELNDESATVASFGLVRMQARTAMCLARASLELLEDARPEDLELVISEAMSKDLALAIDVGALKGQGGTEVLGIKNWSGISSDNFTVVTPDEISEMASLMAASDFVPTAIITHPTIEGRLSRYKDGDGRYIFDESLPANIKNVPRLTTSQLATSDLVIGDFSRLWIAYRTQLRFEASREGSADGKSAFSTLGVIFRAYLRVDAMITHPAAFVFNSSITS